MLQKISILMQFRFFYLSNSPEINVMFSRNIKQYSCCQHIIIIRIRSISEGSCDTEDWSNDAEKSSFFFFLIGYIKIDKLF